MDNELEKIEAKLRKLQMEKARMEGKDSVEKRKAENRMKYAVGGLFLKKFEIDSIEDAEKIAIYFQKAVLENRHRWEQIDLEKYKKEKSE